VMSAEGIVVVPVNVASAMGAFSRIAAALAATPAVLSSTPK